MSNIQIFLVIYKIKTVEQLTIKNQVGGTH